MTDFDIDALFLDRTLLQANDLFFLEFLLEAAITCTRLKGNLNEFFLEAFGTVNQRYDQRTLAASRVTNGQNQIISSFDLLETFHRCAQILCQIL